MRFDNGDENLFAWPNDVLERVVFDSGTQVHILADDEIGVVKDATEVDGKIFYSVRLPGGVEKTALEAGYGSPLSPTRSSFCAPGRWTPPARSTSG